MTVTRKFKAIFVAFALAAAVLTASVFGVSFAKWSGGTATVSATAHTGTWNVYDFSHMTETQMRDTLKETLKLGDNAPIEGVLTSTGKAVPLGEEILLEAGETFVVFANGNKTLPGVQILNGRYDIRVDDSAKDKVTIGDDGTVTLLPAADGYYKFEVRRTIAEHMFIFFVKKA